MVAREICRAKTPPSLKKVLPVSLILDSLNQLSESVTENECRRAVGLLNTLRLKRVEHLKDGYDVSVIVC